MPKARTPRAVWKAYVVPGARMPADLGVCFLLAKFTVCPCDMGIILMYGEHFGCSCENKSRSRREAWLIADQCFQQGRFEFVD